MTLKSLYLIYVSLEMMLQDMGGGVVLYIHKSSLPDLCHVSPRDDHVETICVTTRIGTIFIITSLATYQKSNVSYVKMEHIKEYILSRYQVFLWVISTF